jgi:hypothetical protein
MELRSQLDDPTVLSVGKEPCYPRDRMLGWDPELMWMLWNREVSLATAGNQTLVIKLTELSWLYYKYSLRRNIIHSNVFHLKNKIRLFTVKMKNINSYSFF